MYELPADFDLSSFVGAETSLITIGLYQMNMNFSTPPGALGPFGNISIEGAWELTQHGARVDASEGDGTPGVNEKRDAYRIHKLLGRRVTGWAPLPPWAFRLDFEGGYSLRIADESKGRYEYVAIQRPIDSAMTIFL